MKADAEYQVVSDAEKNTPEDAVFCHAGIQQGKRRLERLQETCWVQKLL